VADAHPARNWPRDGARLPLPRLRGRNDRDSIAVSAAWRAITMSGAPGFLFAISLAMMIGKNDLVIVTL
jgi:hypothetical protein